MAGKAWAFGTQFGSSFADEQKRAGKKRVQSILGGVVGVEPFGCSQTYPRVWVHDPAAHLPGGVARATRPQSPVPGCAVAQLLKRPLTDWPAGPPDQNGSPSFVAKVAHRHVPPTVRSFAPIHASVVKFEIELPRTFEMNSFSAK